jgi:hypothetical protein
VALLTPDRFSSFDVSIDGVGFVLDESDPSPFQLQCQDDALEKTSIDTLLEQNKLDTLYWGINRSWHEGQGQARLDVPPRFTIDPTTASSPYKHLRSKGVDITTRGQLTLLHKTSLALALTNLDPAPQKIAVTDSYVFIAAGQPNIKRFAALDASDVVTLTSATATNQEVRDFATDGSMVFAALGVDGISRATVQTYTQREAFDVTTGWAFTSGSGTFNANSAFKKEGAASLQVNATVAAGATAIVQKTEGVWDFSAVTQFTLWSAAQTSAQPFAYTVRFVTSSGNYFEASLPAATGDFIQTVLDRATGFTTTGTPAWNNINALAFTMKNNGASSANPSAWFDDLESAGGPTFSTWGSWDARVLGWANDQLFAAGIKTGTQWRFYKAASGTGGAEVYVLPDGWSVTSIRALGGLVYFSASRGGKGIIYAYDGVNSPIIAAPFDAIGNGTIPLAMVPFSGAGMLILCRRLTSIISGGLGVVYRAFPDAVGALRVERVALLGADDGRDYGPRCGIAYGDFSYFGWNYGDEPTGENFLVDTTKRSGLGIYFPETGGYGRSYLTPTGSAVSGIVEDASVFKGRRIFTVGGVGLYVEGTTYEPEGGVQTSLIDVNVSADKIWLAEESYYSATENITSPVSHAYSLNGTTWVNDTGAGGAGSSVRVRTSFATLGLKTPSIYARTRLTTTSGTVTPVLFSTGIGGYPATKPLPVHALMIRAYPASERLDISRTQQRHDGWAVLGRLITLWQNQTIVDYQPPWAFSDPTQAQGISYKVRVAQVQASKGWNAKVDATGGIAQVQLKVCP